MNRQLSIMALVTFALAVALSACGTLSGNELTFKTADPRLTIGFRLQQPPPLPAVEPQVVPPTATEVPLLPTVTPTPECLIKVNRSSSGEFIYHTPDSAAYDQTIIEPAKGEFYACNEQEAIDFGARKALR